MTLGSIAQMKSLFIDKALVEGKVDKATAIAFRKVGGRTRLRARSSIRKAPKKGRKGGRRAPYSQTGLLKKFIFFAIDPATNSVVTGPAKLDSTTGDVPSLLEFGGVKKINGESVTYPEFPYMRPAFEYGIAGIDRDLAGSVK